MMFLNINNLDDFFEKVGIIITTFLFLHFFSTIILRILTFPFRRTYIKKYGANSWALVTGASDGIGKAFCQELAQEGFNILLIARNKEKLEKVCQELKEINHNVQTKIIIMDFKKAHLPGAFDHLLPELKSLDISILVNNVGMGLLGHFEELSEEQILEIMGLNIYPLTRLSKILLPQLEKRAHRSAIINVGSMAGIRPCPYFSVYSASKVYTDFFTKALSVEYPKVDMICVSPFYVSTPATLNRKVSFDTITANDCARSTMNDLGFTTSTYGHWKHDIFGKGAILMPQWFLDFFAKTSALMEIKRREKVSKSE